MYKTALILEGGSLRTFFTAGILDYFVKHNINFDYINGVSAGAMCACDYLSKQAGRVFKTNLHFLHDKRYLSLRNWIFHKEMFNLDFMFSSAFEDYLPFDYQTFYDNKTIFEITATNCLTGKNKFFQKDATNKWIAAVKASSSMPIFSKIITIDHIPYLDGGISNSIPFQRALNLGYKKIVIILTRDLTYSKSTNKRFVNRIIRSHFYKYPNFVKAVISRPSRYNQQVTKINRLNGEGKVFVIRPQKPVTVSRMEKDKTKLKDLYQQGLEIIQHKMPLLKAYLEKPIPNI